MKPTEMKGMAPFLCAGLWTRSAENTLCETFTDFRAERGLQVMWSDVLFRKMTYGFTWKNWKLIMLMSQAKKHEVDSELGDRIRLQQCFAFVCSPLTPPKKYEACRHLRMQLSNGFGNYDSASWMERGTQVRHRCRGLGKTLLWRC